MHNFCQRTWCWEINRISAAYRVRGYHTDIEQSILSELRAKHYEIALVVAGVALNSSERLGSNHYCVTDGNRYVSTNSGFILK